jgi:2-polyprenyl-3-methyl-5-hydroxy-6-metoxy-1,4-benzoquinol methylase
MTSQSTWTFDEIMNEGERVTHLNKDYLFYAHLAIYNFAAQFCRGADVLDVGSGAGYGPAHLATAGAKTVMGLDASSKAVEFSRQHFSLPNLEYRCMPAEAINGFAPASFDFIFTSNTLEHIPDVYGFMRHAWRLLRPEGKLLIGVPPINSDAAMALNLQNPYHINIWSPRQWYHTVSQFFTRVDCYSHWVGQVGGTLTPEQINGSAPLTEKDFIFAPTTLDAYYSQGSYTVILLAHGCRPEHELPAVGAAVKFIDDSFTRTVGYISPSLRRRLAQYLPPAQPPPKAHVQIPVHPRILRLHDVYERYQERLQILLSSGGISGVIRAGIAFFVKRFRKLLGRAG